MFHATVRSAHGEETCAIVGVWSLESLNGVIYILRSSRQGTDSGDYHNWLKYEGYQISSPRESCCVIFMNSQGNGGCRDALITTHCHLASPVHCQVPERYSWLKNFSCLETRLAKEREIRRKGKSVCSCQWKSVGLPVCTKNLDGREPSTLH